MITFVRIIYHRLFSIYMNHILRKGLLTALFCFSGMFVFGQTTTIILLRHAEKDTSAPGATMMKADPMLSKEGLARAARLPAELKSFHPDFIYSTRYERTRATVTPLAELNHQEIIFYDPANLEAFSKILLQHQGKNIVVVGHSNTTPALVNLLLGEKKYPNLDESVYGQYWMVTITNGKPSVETRHY